MEVALQSRQPLAGIGTDFVKAFNCIQRAPLWHLAAAIGIPDTLLQPWKSYTEKFTRRFMVSNQVSSPTLSTQGFAEGCPLSVLAMALVDWGYQLYQYHYAPSIRHLSFVDNISMLGRETRDLIWAFFTLRAFLTMWGLSLDLDKTYVWGTTTEIRRQLACLGLRLVSDFSELGGALSFTAAHRVRFFLQRGESLQEKWQQLRRSRAPLHQKLRSLPGVFWARALHGALSTVFADAHLQKLRTQATKHLGLQLTGSNPMLRLSLSQPPTADPGFYQLKTAILDFRRLCHKSPDLVHYWRIYMDRFDGALRDGPFSKMLSLLNGIAWKILTPPMLQDHDGYCFDFLQIAKGALERLLHDGWLQWVATQVNHKTMEGLQGIDIALTVLDHEKLVALDLARVRCRQGLLFLHGSMPSMTRPNNRFAPAAWFLTHKSIGSTAPDLRRNEQTAEIFCAGLTQHHLAWLFICWHRDLRTLLTSRATLSSCRILAVTFIAFRGLGSQITFLLMVLFSKGSLVT